MLTEFDVMLVAQVLYHTGQHRMHHQDTLTYRLALDS